MVRELIAPRNDRVTRDNVRSNTNFSWDRGVRLLKPRANAVSYKPSWFKTHTIIRILPVRDVDTNEYDEFRTSADSVGVWLRTVDAAVELGTQKLTFALRPSDTELGTFDNCPVVVLRRKLTEAVNASLGNPAWARLVQKQDNQRPILPAPKRLFLVQCIILVHKSNTLSPYVGFDDAGPTAVLYMSHSLGQRIFDYALTVDAAGNYVCPDLVNINGGAFVDIFEEGTPPLGQLGGPAPSVSLGQAASSSGGHGSRAFANYDYSILPSFANTQPALTGFEQKVAQKSRAWNDIIWYPTVGEQIEQICAAGGIGADAIMFALDDLFHDDIPGNVRNAARLITATPSAPGIGPGQFGQPGYPNAGAALQSPAPQPAWGQPAQASQPQPQPAQLAAPLWQAPPATVTGPTPNWGGQSTTGEPVAGVTVTMGSGVPSGATVTVQPPLAARVEQATLTQQAPAVSVAPAPQQEASQPPATTAYQQAMNALERARERNRNASSG